MGIAKIMTKCRLFIMYCFTVSFKDWQRIMTLLNLMKLVASCTNVKKTMQYELS